MLFPPKKGKREKKKRVVLRKWRGHRVVVRGSRKIAMSQWWQQPQLLDLSFLLSQHFTTDFATCHSPNAAPVKVVQAWTTPTLGA